MAVTINGDTGVDKVVDNTITTDDIQDGAITAAKIASGAIPNSYAGMKNLIINGDMRIDQRNGGASHTITGLVYGVDRFFTFCPGVNITGQKITGTNTGTAYAYKITGATGATLVNYGQRIENLNALDLNSQTVTVSLKLYASATIPNVNVTLFYCSGVNTGYGSTTASQPITVVSGINTYSVNFTLPSTASNGFECAISFASGIGNGVSVEISQMQLEVGTSATDFENLQYGTQLALCQRYYQQETTTRPGYIPTTTNTNRHQQLWWKVQMRATPTIIATWSAGSNNVGSNSTTGAWIYSGVGDTVSARNLNSWTASSEL